MAIKKLTKENFNTDVLNAQHPVLIDFFATWCGPCKMLSPLIEEVADEKKGQADIFKCDIDENKELAEKFNIFTVPTCIVIKDGKETSRINGLRPKTDFITAIQNA